jgi:chemotaxis protein CheX
MATVLILERNLSFLDNLAYTLTAEGYSVLPCGQPKDLDLVMEESLFDVVLLDLDFMENNSALVFDKIFTHPKHKKASLICLAAQPEKEKLFKAMALGASFLFAKPFCKKLLFEKVDLLVNPNTRSRAAFDPSFIKFFLEAAISVFESVAELAIIAGKPFLKTDYRNFHEATAIIQITSPHIKGAMGVNFSKDILTKVLTKMLGSVQVPDEAALKDIGGELCNQILGKAKQLFLKEKNMSFDMSLPKVSIGSSYGLGIDLNIPVLVIPFMYEKSSGIFVEFCLEVNQEDKTSLSSVLAIEEGGFLMFE